MSNTAYTRNQAQADSELLFSRRIERLRLGSLTDAPDESSQEAREYYARNLDRSGFVPHTFQVRYKNEVPFDRCTESRPGIRWAVSESPYGGGQVFCTSSAYPDLSEEDKQRSIHPKYWPNSLNDISGYRQAHDQIWGLLTNKPACYRSQHDSAIMVELNVLVPGQRPLCLDTGLFTQHSTEYSAEYGCTVTKGQVGSMPITHYHYKDWPDFHALGEEAGERLFRLLWRVSNEMSKKDVIMKCQHGIDRTVTAVGIISIFTGYRSNWDETSHPIKSFLDPLPEDSSKAVQVADRLNESKPGTGKPEHLQLKMRALKWAKETHPREE